MHPKGNNHRIRDWIKQSPMRKKYASILSGLAVGFAVIMPVFSAPTALAQTVESSRNWAGYVAQSGPYTSVSGSWIVPTVSAVGSTSADAEWVGIGGVTTTDLIQSGTQAIIDSNGQITYQAWVETLPQISQPIPITVKPSDSVSVSITQTAANQWQIIFNDLTSIQTFQTTLSYASSQSSAEWIVEAPAVRGGFLPLDNFGAISFSGGSTTINGQTQTIAQSGAAIINMLNNSQQDLANVSPLDASDQSFTVSRTSAAASPPTGRYLISRGRTFRRGGNSQSGGLSGRATWPWNFGGRGLLNNNRVTFQFSFDR